MTDPRGACAQPAGTLAPDIPYVRGWAEGRRAAETLAEQLIVADLADGFPSLRADVNVLGDGVVVLGQVLPKTALRLSALLAAGLLAEQLDEHPGEDATSVPGFFPSDRGSASRPGPAPQRRSPVRKPNLWTHERS
ncbi:hypothetical protein ACPXCE_28140 [Streptomyces sp. DT24]|uniref:hypothetical protein n=1 Tax=Streptomyces sp. DT24 TaxID=3416520 RepID=UPI003CEF88FB